MAEWTGLFLTLFLKKIFLKECVSAWTELFFNVFFKKIFISKECVAAWTGCAS